MKNSKTFDFNPHVKQNPKFKVHFFILKQQKTDLPN